MAYLLREYLTIIELFTRASISQYFNIKMRFTCLTGNSSMTLIRYPEHRMFDISFLQNKIR